MGGVQFKIIPPGSKTKIGDIVCAAIYYVRLPGWAGGYSLKQFFILITHYTLRIKKGALPFYLIIFTITPLIRPAIPPNKLSVSIVVSSEKLPLSKLKIIIASAV